MNLKKFLIFFTTCLMIFFMACEDDKADDKKDPLFSIQTPEGNNPESIKITPDEGSSEIEIKSNCDWKIEKPTTDSWLTIAPTSGKGDCKIIITSTVNESTEPRQSELSFYAADKKVSSLKIIQDPQKAFLSVDPKSAQIPAEGGEVSFKISTNVNDWEYTFKGENSSWLTEKTKDATNLTFIAAKNTITAEQKVILEFSAPGYSDLTQQVEITQEAAQEKLVADLLDVVFNTDGSAKDISPMNHVVEKVAGSAMMTYYNDGYERYVARYNHTPSTTISSGYFKIDYVNNQEFKNKLSASHSLETVFMFDAEPQIGKEVKMFSSMESGGTGFLFTTQTGEITFLPNLGSWQWTRSGVVPEKGKYYHVVGVWDKQNQKSSIYVNGELKNSIDAKGDFKFPYINACHWFCIGGDPAGSNVAQNAWKGDVVVSRIYSKPLSAENVTTLWEQVKDKQSTNTIQLSDILFLSNFEVKPGSKYRISGKGFKNGDVVRFESLTSEGTNFSCDGQATENSITVEIPNGFKTGEYRMVLKRSDSFFPLGISILKVTENPEGLRIPKVIAHRGYHTVNGAPHNSIASLKGAQKLGVYGSEADFYITKDDVIVAFHDPTINNIRIEDANYPDIKDLKLANNEALPTLDAFLTELKKDPAMKLVIEIKSHSTNTNNDRAVNKIFSMVNEQGLNNQVDYIAFSYFVCQQLAKKVPSGTTIGYLSGDKAPNDIEAGINCIDYSSGALRNNPQWIKEAHARGMTVNVWTVNSDQDLMDFIAMGVDFITTDYPDKLNSIIQKLTE